VKTADKIYKTADKSFKTADILSKTADILLKAPEKSPLRKKSPTRLIIL
jgi:hypothetical protein